jgi:hypothetical protein
LLPAKQDYQVIEPGAVDGLKIRVAEALQLHIFDLSSQGLAAWNDPRNLGFRRHGWLCLNGGSHPMDHVIVKTYLSGPLILAPSLKSGPTALSILPRFTALQMQKED